MVENSGSERLKPQDKKKFDARLFLVSMLAFMNTSIDDLFEKRGIFQDITTKEKDDPEDVPVD